MRKHLTVTCEAVHSDYHWAYLHLLDVLAEALGMMEGWMMACACHPSSVCEDLGIEAVRASCPMRGRRVSEICCDGVEPTIDEIFDVTYLRLLPHCTNLVDGDRAEILQEFSIGKVYILAEAQIRWSCMGDLPLKLFCAGHWDEDIARTQLAMCLILYENIDPAVREDS